MPCLSEFKGWRRSMLLRIHPDKGGPERLDGATFSAFKDNTTCAIRWCERLNERRKSEDSPLTLDEILSHNKLLWDRRRLELTSRFDMLCASFGGTDLRAEIRAAKEGRDAAVRADSPEHIQQWTDALEGHRARLPN